MKKEQQFYCIGGHKAVGGSYLEYYYDIDTKVIYAVYTSYNNGGGITPLYNADGTLKLYTGE